MLPLREIRRREKGPTIRRHRRKTSPRRKPSSASLPSPNRSNSSAKPPYNTSSASAASNLAPRLPRPQPAPPLALLPLQAPPHALAPAPPLPKPPLPPLTEEEMQISLSDIAVNSDKIYRQLDSWFRLVLREWDIALASRPLSVKQSYQGKMATTAYTQASQYIAPFFKHLEKRDLHPDIFPEVSEIVHHAQHRRYVTANDVYLKLSIGNAAWPIGVTMVGIHERSAREKLHEKGMAAHIMSDEVTRKYLQSIKRCLKFCQTRWLPEDQLQLMG
ncbi:Prp18 domain-containing protein [Kalaharituber pfeilii]|nr:Prp18 domain-containing protein [Kalaharituber pfeilii]